MFKLVMINASTKRAYGTRKFYACYMILKSKINSTPSEIKENYHKLSKKYHPDNHETGNYIKFIGIKNAYEMIKDAPLKDHEHIDQGFRPQVQEDPDHPLYQDSSDVGSTIFSKFFGRKGINHPKEGQENC